jgi:hypothetical protein
VLSCLELAILPATFQSKENAEMDTIAGWALALFFLWYGLAAFVPALNTDTFRKVGAVLALIVGIVSVLGLLGM